MQTTTPAPAPASNPPAPTLAAARITPLMITALEAGIPPEDVAAYALAPRTFDAGRWE